MKVIRAVILIVVILGLTYLVFHISKLNDNIVNLEDEVEVQKVFVEQLEERIKEIIMEKGVLKTDINNLQSDNQLLKIEIDTLKGKYEDFKRTKEERDTKENEPSRGSYSRSKLLGTFEATAYTDDVASQGKWVGQTASGMKPQVGVIAVDPKVIPLGTKLYVEGYGNAIAGDVGGAIKGNRIDVFLTDKKSCMDWGRKQVKVWVVK